MKEKKPPLKLRLFGHEWTVERTNLSKHTDYIGRKVRSPGKRTIYIDEEISGAELEDTLIHECTHAVADECHIKLTEQQVQILALGLQQMLAPFLRVEV